MTQEILIAEGSPAAVIEIVSELLETSRTELLVQDGPSELLEIEGPGEQLVVTETVYDLLEGPTVADLVEIGIQGPAGPPGPVGVSYITLRADGPVGGQRVVRPTADGVTYVDPTDPSQAGGVIGITTAAAADGADCFVQQYGRMEDSTWAWTPGRPVFIGAAGTLTQVPPASGFVETIGVAVSATAILVQIQPPFVLEN